MVEITGFEVDHTTIARKETFQIATGSSTESHGVIIKLRGDGLEGLGACCPNSVTGGDPAEVEERARELAGDLVGKEFFSVRDILDHAMEAENVCAPALAGVDQALLDLWGKHEGEPVHRLFASYRDRLTTDITLGMGSPDHVVKKAQGRAAEGFGSLKIKVGADPVTDAELVRSVRDAVGPAVEIRCDVNQGYDFEGALEFVQGVQNSGISILEQPVPAGDWDLIRAVAEVSPVPVFVDEGFHSLEDLKRIITQGMPLGINIKLQKVGGFSRALAMGSAAVEAGIPVMLGCYGETRMGIAAALHLGLCLEQFPLVDLDSFLNLDGDPTTGGFDIDRDTLSPLKKDGFGCDFHQ